MNWCKRCIIPDTRPQIVFKDGICSACLSHETKKKIDWKAKEKEFRKFADKPCLIPVSGGKDSTWQIVMCLKYGLKPTLFTWVPPCQTELGGKNLDNLQFFGLSHLKYFRGEKEKTEIRNAFDVHGDPGLVMHTYLRGHVRLFASAYRFIIWGENPRQEYSCNMMGKNKPWEIYLGDYFPYDPVISCKLAKQCGFQAADKPTTGYYKFSDLDDHITPVHHWLKWPKYGFTRAHDNLSIEIRNGRIGRKEAWKIARELGHEPPMEDIEIFCKYLGITEKHFWAVVKRFTKYE